ncbi:Metal-response element-binding transcription factor 2 [Halotydeus destructor]|nr:Metal-response element-binding transcription factor 2 [Halotydeus destructor]
MADSDIKCATCNDGTDTPKNQIVLCDSCNLGYHQHCHKPKIDDKIVNSEEPWYCRSCAFALGTKDCTVKQPKKMGLKLSKTSFPYETEGLDWDDLHRMNKQNVYCYCGEAGQFHSKMLQCCKCYQWFHEGCIGCLETPLLYGDHYYIFSCAICNNGKESLKRIIMKWSDVVALVLHNLNLQKGNRFFEMMPDIIPFVRNNCHMIKLSEDINKLSNEELADKISSILVHNPLRFMSGKLAKRKASSWGIRPVKGSHHIFAPPHASVMSHVKPRTSETPSVQLSPTSAPSSIITEPEKPKRPPPLKPIKTTKEIKIVPIESTIKIKSKLIGSRATMAKANSGQSTPSMSGSEATSDKSISCTKKVVRKRLKKHKEYPLVFPQISLEKVIPFPENFEGPNNPFFDLDSKAHKKSKKRKHSYDGHVKHTIGQLEEDYIVKASADSPSKLTIQRVSLSPTSKDAKSASVLSSPSAKLNCSKDDSEPCKIADDDSYKVLARRFTGDGKVEYLLEFEPAANCGQ